MQFLHCVDGLYHLVYFWSGWYWLFLSLFSASFRSSCKAGQVVMNSLSNCLFIKNFISPSLMKLSLAGYAILGRKFLSLRMLNIGPHSLLVLGFCLEIHCESDGLPFVGNLTFLSGCPYHFFPSFQCWWIWWLCALGLLFLRNIFVVFSIFPGLECWPALPGWGSSPG